MKNALVCVRWESVRSLMHGVGLSLNSRQERLHELSPGDALWPVSRKPADAQPDFVARLVVSCLRLNPHGSEATENYVRFGFGGASETRRFFGRSFFADGL